MTVPPDLRISGQVMLHEDHRTGPDLGRWLRTGNALERALAEPDGLLDLVRDADLRGMGGAGYPTHLKWRAVAAAAAGERVLVVNGNEDEPGTFKDHILLRHSPHQVIEGALITAVAIRARRVVLYINPTDPAVAAGVHQAISEWPGHPCWHRLETALGGTVHLTMHLAHGLYVGGEETAAIRAIEGGFPFPHRKPPYPTDAGVDGLPTLVNNVETVAQVVHVVRRGANGYRALGRHPAAGTKIYCLSGDVLHPGAYELPLGTSLRDLVFRHGGGMPDGRPFKAAFTGGPSNTLLTERDLDTALSWDALRACGARLGTGAMIVVAGGTGIAGRVAGYARFFAASSCGQCPPCTIGTRQLAQLLERIADGNGIPADLDQVRNLCRMLPGSGRCGLVDAACTVVESSMSRLPDDYTLAVGRQQPAESRPR